MSIVVVSGHEGGGVASGEMPCWNSASRQRGVGWFGYESQHVRGLQEGHFMEPLVIAVSLLDKYTPVTMGIRESTGDIWYIL